MFKYKGTNGVDSICEIKVQGHIVLATELACNTGQSITNAVERLATEVCEACMIPHDKIIWVEHYPASDYKPVETFDEVKFDVEPVTGRLKNPKWANIADINRFMQQHS